jgi:hypothetical protein
MPTEVRCVEGCGDPTLAIVSIVIAIVSVGVAITALLITRRSFKMAKAEHEVFLDQLGARADLSVNVSLDYPEADEDGVIVTRATRQAVRVLIGVESIGQKAAEHVGFNVLLPLRADEPKWTNQRGRITDPGDPTTTPEQLTTSDGEEHPTHYVDKITDRIGSEHRASYVTFHVELTEAGEEVRIPIKGKVWCDDMPEGVDERVKKIELTLRRV